MLKIGLTGGIAAGKSAVSRRLVQHGAQAIDADALAREVVEPGTDGLQALVAEFGPRVLAPDGSLDRPKLGRIVFADPQRRLALNAILHPRIAGRTAELMAEAPDDAVIVHDVPLLVENGMAARYHLVVVVGAPADVRLRRLTVDRGMSRDDALSRIRSQATDEQRRAVADVWLENTGDLAGLERSVDDLWDQRLSPFAQNLRAGRFVRRPDRPVLCAYDPEWPVQAARVARRVADAAGSRGLGVEHVGSTAVPGLAAKDVIDLQLGVSSLADAQALADPLSEAGFPFAFTAQGCWDERRIHGSCDPGRLVHLHVRVRAAPGWRWNLLFRDWLRAQAHERDGYAAHKARLASTHPHTSGYGSAKDPWFEDAIPRAEAWAKQTGWRLE